MTASKLLDWHHAWKLQDDTLCCRKCGSAQIEKDCDEDLQHSVTCSSRELSKTPWNELKALIAQDVTY
jgi:hypothetical protein